jgi:pimeloyl-ACP methyl ester carboxylesterase
MGQGDHTISSDAKTEVSLPAQARKLLDTLDELLITDKSETNTIVIDIAGFSFGGRVAMATACLCNDRGRDSNGVRIRRLHLTGVGCDRSDFGHLAMQSFPDFIRSDPSLRSFAWAILLATYSSGYLRSLPATTLERFLNHIASSNDPEGLLAILDQAEVRDTADPWHVTNMAFRLSQSQLNNTVGKLCVGEFDTMAPIDEVERLCDTAEWIEKGVDVLSDCGHAVVLEKARAWRDSVLCFLDDRNSNGGDGPT